MKTLAIATLASSIFLSGCASYSNLHGSGEAAKVTMPTQGIDQIEVHGIGELVLQPEQDDAELSITGDHNLLEELEIERRGSTLVIKPKTKFYGNWKPTMPLVYSLNHNVTSVELAGSVDLTADSVAQSAFFVSIAGSSLVNLALDVEQFDVNVAGSGRIYASGKVEDMRMDVSGSGRVFARELTGESADLQGVGSSYMEVGEFDMLEVSAIGSSRVFYDGEPNIRTTAIGSARVTPAQ